MAAANDGIRALIPKRKDKIPGDQRAIKILTDRLNDQHILVRYYAKRGLIQLYNLDEIRQNLLRRSTSSSLDPQQLITEEDAARQAKKLEKSPEEIRKLYEELAPKFKLQLEWLKKE